MTKGVRPFARVGGSWWLLDLEKSTTSPHYHSNTVPLKLGTAIRQANRFGRACPVAPVLPDETTPHKYSTVRHKLITAGRGRETSTHVPSEPIHWRVLAMRGKMHEASSDRTSCEAARSRNLSKPLPPARSGCGIQRQGHF